LTSGQKILHFQTPSFGINDNWKDVFSRSGDTSLKGRHGKTGQVL